MKGAREVEIITLILLVNYATEITAVALLLSRTASSIERALGKSKLSNHQVRTNGY